MNQVGGGLFWRCGLSHLHDTSGLPVGNDLVLELFRLISRFRQRLPTGSNGPNVGVVECLFSTKRHQNTRTEISRIAVVKKYAGVAAAPVCHKGSRALFEVGAAIKHR